MTPFTDALTGLPNRKAFCDRLSYSSARAGCSVLFIDIDKLSYVNGALGANQGDKILCAVAHRLQAVAQPPAFVARVGGDEFAILAAPESADDIAARLHEEVRPMFAVERREAKAKARSAGISDPPDRAFLTLSIGIVQLAAAGTNVQELLMSAEHACLQAKAEGCDRTHSR